MRGRATRNTGQAAICGGCTTAPTGQSEAGAMNSSKHGNANKQITGSPYIISYIKGDRRLADSARSLGAAKAKIEARLAKRHNRGERAEVYHRHELVFSV